MAADDSPLLRPLGLSDLLDEVFAIYRRGFRTFVAIAAVVQVPLAFVTLPLAPLYASYLEQLTGGGAAGFEALSAFTGGAAVLLVAAVVLGVAAGILELGAVAYATAGYYAGEPPSVERAYREALGRFWPLLRLLLLLGLLSFGLLLLAVLPAIFPALLCVSFPAVGVGAGYLAVSWSLAPAALTLEGRPGALHALSRSRDLVHGAWWRTCASLFLLLLLLAVLQLTASVLVQIVGVGLQALAAPEASIQPGWVAVVISLLGNLEGVLLGPLFYIGLTLLYYDRRIRAEGYDLALRARALRPADGAAAGGEA
jgi:hypothetical protein